MRATVNDFECGSGSHKLHYLQWQERAAKPCTLGPSASFLATVITIAFNPCGCASDFKTNTPKDNTGLAFGECPRVLIGIKHKQELVSVRVRVNNSVHIIASIGLSIRGLIGPNHTAKIVRCRDPVWVYFGAANFVANSWSNASHNLKQF